MTDLKPFASGANQTEVRAHNERLLLSVLHRHGAQAGSDLARVTGLSSQTVSVILRKLEQDGLVKRGASQKGRVGKPSVPMSICPEGLFSWGIKIGRRSTDLVLMDVTGGLRAERRLRYAYPMPREVFSFLNEQMTAIGATLSPSQRSRICGIGLATPYDLWRWHMHVGAPKASLEAWRELDPLAEIATFSPLRVFAINDATAACRAEHMFGQGQRWRDSVYFFVASFFGGGVVLNGSVYEGSRGNAGALGPLPARLADGQEGRLLDVASLSVLERRLGDAGIDPQSLWRQPRDWSAHEDLVAPWIEDTALALAKAALASCAVIDFQAVLIDGAMPASVRARLVARVQDFLPTLDARGLIRPEVAEGTIGAKANAIGAAAKPLIAQYLVDSHAGFYNSA